VRSTSLETCAVVMAAGLLAAGCASSDGKEDEATETARQAIVNATQPSPDAVVALMSGEGHVECSGTLVARQLVVTAAHCIRGEAPREVQFGEDPLRPTRTVAVAERRAHPKFDAVSLENDPAVLWLASPVVDVTPAELPRTSALPETGALVRVAGFGRTGPLGTAQTAPLRRAGTARVSTIDGDHVALEPAPAQPCTGDSGGPVFRDDASNELVAVTSRGDGACAFTSVTTAVAGSMDELVTPWLRSPPFASKSADASCGSAGAAPSSAGGASIVSCLVLAFAARRRGRTR